MTTKTPSKANQTAVVRARCTTALKRAVIRATDKTGLNESAFVQTALHDFFAKHRTPAALISRIKAFRAAST